MELNKVYVEVRIPCFELGSVIHTISGPGVGLLLFLLTYIFS